jgi:hypothetical protein
VTLLELTYQRRKAKAEAAGLLDKAMSESRPLSIAEQVRFDALTVRLQEFDGQIAQRKSLRKMVE